MIRKSIKQTKRATYALLAPDPKLNGLPAPRGTCFFINPDGYILTANHVINGINVSKVILQQPPGYDNLVGGMVNGIKLVKQWEQFDLALLKAEFSPNANKECFQGLDEFPALEIDANNHEEGTPVYSYGFPLSGAKAVHHQQGMSIGTVELGPRTTSAIISSTLEKSKMIQSAADSKTYVLDKALNYGNSGGPVVLQENGKVFAVCARFQPMIVPQSEDGTKYIMIPSLYSIVESMSNIDKELLSILNE